MKTLHKEKYGIQPGCLIHVIGNMIQDGIDLHQHTFSEIAIVTSGRGLHITGGNQWRLTRGDAYCIRHGRSHSISEVYGLEMMLILFDDTVLEQCPLSLRMQPGFIRFFETQGTPNATERFMARTRLQESALETIKIRGHRLRDAIEKNQEGFPEYIRNGFWQIAELLAMGALTGDRYEISPRQAVEKAQSYIQLYYWEKITLDFLAELAGTTPRSFCRWFRQKTGCSPMDYLLKYRLEQAAKLLHAEEITVTEAAYRAGFRDSNYFSRQFRSVYKIPPRDYQQQTHVPKRF